MRFSELVELLEDTGYAPRMLVGRRTSLQVACAPTLVGRVMSCAFDALRGDTLGWIGVEAIQRGAVDPVFNNFGGEERIWFGPEGSQFGLHFADETQSFAAYRVQPAMSSQPYTVLRQSQQRDFLVMCSRIELSNLQGTSFILNVERTIRLVEVSPYHLGVDGSVETIGFQSETLITNIGPRSIGRQTGFLSCWTPGTHPNGSGRFVIMPFRASGSHEKGDPVLRDYFKNFCLGGRFPAERWRVGRDHAVLKSDGVCRVKVSLGPKRALNRIGSISVDGTELAINDFDLYPELPYVAAFWREISPEEALQGEAVSSYIDGPDEKGNRAGDFYELETLSPALQLKPGESFVHRNRVVHLRGACEDIDEIAKRFLNVSTQHIVAVFAGR
jgi:hypothetical protein